jgi:hypothetical protein
LSAPAADRGAQRALVERSALARPGSVLWDAPSSTLLDVFSGKALPLDFARIVAVEERVDAASGRPYAAIRLDSGVEVAVADPGIAFPPVTDATGPLDGLPSAVCFRDLAAAQARLEHLLRDHPGERPAPEHVALFLFCLAVLDGARAAGFEVSPEERRLDGLLEELEARRRA